MKEYNHTNAPRCKDNRPCRFKDYMGRCMILTETYKNGKCPFIKT